MDITSTLAQLEGYVVSSLSVGGNENRDAEAQSGLKLVQQIQIARIQQQQQQQTTTFNSNNSMIMMMMVSDLQYIQALECGILCTIQLQDLDNFIRHYQLLQPLYQMYNNNNNNNNNNDDSVQQQQQQLPRKNHIIGLYLMSLLVTASSSEFHSELELLFATTTSSSSSNRRQMENDPYIQFPISLERKLMVGIYDEIFNMTLPCIETYSFFMEQLVSTVRDAIADCIEVSYISLSLLQTATIMKFDTSKTDPVQELLEYIEVAREDWIVNTDTKMITFQQHSNSNNNNNTPSGPIITGQDVPSQQWIQQTLTYATEMERII